MLLIFSGLPGAGKTTIARLLAQELGATYLRVDTIEQALREGGVDEINGKGYIVAYRIAAENLSLGKSVIADTVNPWPLTREAWRAVTTDSGHPYLEIEIICSDQAEHRRRIESRQPDIADFNLPTWSEVLERDYHPWDRPILVIDTATQTPSEAVERIRQAMP